MIRRTGSMSCPTHRSSPTTLGTRSSLGCPTTCAATACYASSDSICGAGHTIAGIVAGVWRLEISCESSPALLLMSRRPTLSCSLFVRPFSLFCRECSSHRVANEGLGPPTLRICDRCAFSAAHPEHLGCERPFACPRCSAPRNVAQLVIYLQLGLRLLACCALCNPWHWSSASAKPLAAATALSTGAGGSADHAATP